MVYSSSLLFHLLEIDLLGPISLGRCFGGTAIRPYPGWVDGMHGSDGMDSPYIHTARNPRTMGWSFTTLSLDQQRISSICASIKIESLVSENNIWTFMIRIHQSPLLFVIDIEIQTHRHKASLLAIHHLSSLYCQAICISYLICLAFSLLSIAWYSTRSPNCPLIWKPS